MKTKFQRSNFVVTALLFLATIASIVIYITYSVEWNNLSDRDPTVVTEAYQYLTKMTIGYQSSVMSVLLLLCYFHGINLF